MPRLHNPNTFQFTRWHRVKYCQVQIILVRLIHTMVLLPEHAPGSFCTCQYTRGSVFKFAQFAPGACSQISNLLNIVEHFEGWKFCFRGLNIPMKSLVHTEELCSRRVPLEHAPGANSSCVSALTKLTRKSLTITGNKIESAG